MDKISIIVPCYNESESLFTYYKETTKILLKIKTKYEIIFIDDGSTDNTLKIIKDLARKNQNIKYLSLSRNFGKEAALIAGLNISSGNIISFMDADLQDPPYLLLEMYKLIKNSNYDVVYTRRIDRKGENKLISLFSNLFYKIINKISDYKLVQNERDYRMFNDKVRETVLKFSEYNVYIKGIFSFIGFNSYCIEYTNVNRKKGKSKYGFVKLFKLANNAITNLTTIPLSLASFLGFVVCLISFLAMIFIIIKTILYGDPVSGWPSMVCILLFISGIQLLCMGFIGKYLANTYMETKHRPLYIVKEDNLKNKK